MRAADPRLSVRRPIPPQPGTQPLRPQIRGGKSLRPIPQTDSLASGHGDACAEPASHPPDPSARKGNNTPSERQAG